MTACFICILVPKLASAAEYFFKMGVEEKRFRPTVLLLMATTLNVPIPRSAPQVDADSLSRDLRTRQQCIAAINEMIHGLPPNTSSHGYNHDPWFLTTGRTTTHIISPGQLKPTHGSNLQPVSFSYDLYLESY
ncbi:hypothetical protein HAX54_013328 [Datura stramonium]|uniref:Uncharacterized protein n=1 Tax=Datura stramonium TaxID=4076 RepID=A0ABS8RJ57_DATST|nr:hypothetical protein [Datura stramonium]